MPFSMTLPFSTNTLIISLLCLGIFFSLPTQDFFRGQGKIKVGTGAEIIHSIRFFMTSYGLLPLDGTILPTRWAI